jgi:hypothetical protein
MIRKFLHKLLYKLLLLSAPKKTVHYKIGNLKHQNARVDGLSPMLVEIGDNFVSAPGSIILSHDASPFLRTGKFRVERTVIGDNVFLGANAVIMPGVQVGDGAIIGAGSIVTKDVEPEAVVAGNPARRLCSADEYFQKCEEKGCLYQPPKAYEVLRKDGRPPESAKLEYQRSILAELERRGE